MELASVYGHDPSDIRLSVIGAKPGEKQYEELLNNEETRRTMELEKYYAVLPAFQGIYSNISYDYPGVVAEKVTSSYNSANESYLSKPALRKFLTENNLLKNNY
jgi:FlaA1/EpsC-like NDP-sugar epimerase